MVQYLPMRPGAKFIYDWNAIQQFRNAGNTVKQCIEKFGFSRASWDKSVKNGRIISGPRGIPLDTLLVSGRKQTCRKALKLRLVKILAQECAECGISEWRDKLLSLHLDHINGDKHDNRLGNLRLLCPNCHSQTETYGGRNVRRKRSLLGGGNGRPASL